MTDNREHLDAQIVYDRDFSYDFFAYKTLEKSYLLRLNGKIVERPQHMIMRVAIGIHCNPDDPASTIMEKVIETYTYMSQKWFTHASPTLFNAGTCSPQLSSCFLLTVTEDSIEGIYETLKRCALISKTAGGIGLAIHNIRATNSYISGTNGASNGIVHIIDEVLLPCPAEPADGKHLWFRGFTLSDESDPSGKYQCGEVDAGPRLPDDIFDPSNAAALKAYEAATIALFSFCNTRGCTFGPFLELGRCADKNYTVLGHSKTNGQTFPNKTERVDWAPHKLMDGVCQKQCLCNFGNGTGGKPSLQLPTCQDQPDDPRARKFCSLCGPKYNTPIEISLFECGVPSCPRPSKPPSSCSWPLCNTTGRCCSEVCRDEGCGAHCPICGPGVGTPGDSCYGCSASSDCNRSC